MDKVICDICGTSYPATADQCPICGCEKSANPIADEEFAREADPSPAYKPVKGGRFSDANVRKRNKTVMAAPVQYDYDLDDEDDDDYDEDEEEYEEEAVEGRSNKGLVAVLIFLIVAILGLILYLYFNFFVPDKKPNQETQPSASTTVTTAAPTETEAPTVPCTGLEVSETDIVLNAVGNAWLLNVVAAPADTTDSITYASSNEAVATVSAEGCITAVGPGEAVITVTCGTAAVECKVTCTIETEPATEATEATEAPTEPEKDWGLNRQEFTLRVGEQWSLYEGDVSTALITFKARDTSVVTISKSGIVTGVGEGWTMVTAEYNGVVKECKVICKPPKTETKPAETTPAVTTPPTTGSET